MLPMPWCKIVREVLARDGGKKEATVWGSPLRLPVQAAAMANSMATHGFELDDRRVAASLHPASGTVSPCLAVAERDGEVSGKKFLTAIAAGYEVACRVGKCIGSPSFVTRGFYPPSFGGAFAAATSTGKLLGLDPEAMTRAFHLTATQASGLYSPTHVKRFNIGVGTRAGVLAAFLAREGYEGVPNIFESEEGGFYRTFVDEYDLGLLTEGLPSDFEIAKVELKPYVSSRPNHTAIDAALELVARSPQIRPENIERIEIQVGSANYRYGAGYVVNTVSRALMSVAYCAAVAIVDGDAFLNQFTMEKVRDPRVQKLLERSSVRIDPKVDRIGLEKRDRTTLTIILKDSSRHEVTKDFAKGHPSNPMSREEVLKKFHTLGGKVFDEKRLGKIIRSLDTVEGMDDVAQIARLMATPS
jgi:aconitate decarboxylase